MAARSASLSVSGARETARAFDKIERDIKRAVRAELALVAEPIAATARSNISRYQGASLNTIKPRVGVRGVFVVQNARKVTGKRGDFGALQMTRGLIPALEEHSDEVVPRLDVAIGLIAARQGF